MSQLHRLFFAIRPNAEAGSMAVGAMLRKIGARGLKGSAVALERLHVTLHWLGDYDDVPQELLTRAKLAGAGIDMAPFSVGFDRIGSLGGVGMGGLALTGGTELAALRRFQRALAISMEAAGIGAHVRGRFDPHVSLLYCDDHSAAEPITPIRWVVNDLVLLDSLVGKSTHVVLANWPLQSRQTSFCDW